MSTSTVTLEQIIERETRMLQGINQSLTNGGQEEIYPRGRLFYNCPPGHFLTYSSEAAGTSHCQTQDTGLDGP